MAGSYNHVTNKGGQLRSPDSWLIDNLGDAYETIEEMYGMIWWLATLISGDGRYDGIVTPAEMVEQARQNYQEGLTQSPGVMTE